MKSRQALIDRLLIAGTFVLAFIYSFRRMTDSDLWGHLKCGEYLFRHGAILKTYYFNFSWPDFPYVNHSWLFQAVIYLVHEASGEAGLIALQTGLVLLSVFLLFKILRMHTDDFAIIAFVLSLGIIASSHRFALRPQHFTYVFLLYFLLSLHKHRLGDGRYIRFMPPVMVVWANMHAECLWGILVPAVYLIVEYAETVMRKSGDAGRLKPLLIVFILVILSSFINPFTYKTPFWPFYVMKEQFAGVEELLSPVTSRYLFFWIYFLIFVLTTAANLKRVDHAWLALSLIFSVAAWSANRGVPHLVFVSAPLITANIEDIRKRYAAIPGMISSGVKMVLTAGIVFIAASVVASPRYFRKYDNIPYPDGALEFLKNNGIKGNVFNEHIWGNFIIWKAHPDLKPYIDGRFFHKRFYDEYYPLLAGLPGWEAVFAKYDVTIALLRYSAGEGIMLNDALFKNPGWRLVYWDDAALVYLKDIEEKRAVTAKYGNADVDPNRNFLYDYEGRPIEFVKRSNALMERNLANAQSSYKALIMSANTFYFLKDYEAAITRYEASLPHLDAPNAWVYYRIALSYRGLGDLVKTGEYLTECLAIAPEFEEAKLLLREVRFLLKRGAAGREP